MVIGILALQGDFAAHRAVLEQALGLNAAMIRTADELDGVDGLVLPGGESTTIGKLMETARLKEAICIRAGDGMPVFGTCAGMILMAKRIVGSSQARLGLIDITVARNAFGRQVDSFETDVPVPAVGEPAVRGVFICAPYVTGVGDGVEVLGRYRDRIVAVRQGDLLATAFHPELTGDTRVHAAFADMCRRHVRGRRQAVQPARPAPSATTRL